MDLGRVGRAMGKVDSAAWQLVLFWLYVYKSDKYCAVLKLVPDLPIHRAYVDDCVEPVDKLFLSHD